MAKKKTKSEEEGSKSFCRKKKKLETEKKSKVTRLIWVTENEEEKIHRKSKGSYGKYIISRVKLSLIRRRKYKKMGKNSEDIRKKQEKREKKNSTKTETSGKVENTKVMAE